MKRSAFIALGMLTATATFAQQGPMVHETVLDGPGAAKITSEIWVDNWFQMYVNGKPLIQDSVPYATERSFNAERVTFRADLPMTVAFEFRDFMQNDTGLEYIGTRRQQVGDGGAIAQFHDAATGKLMAVTNTKWRCQVVHYAPISDNCAKMRNPQPGVGACASRVTAVSPDWIKPGFDDKGWPVATRHSERSVRPKDGYDRIDWDRGAQLIWGPDLRHDNIVYCRTTITR